MNALAVAHDPEEAPSDTAGAVARRATVETLVAHRDRALALYAEAHSAIAAAAAAVDAAKDEARHASPGVNSYNWSHQDEKAAFVTGIKVPEREPFLATARRLIDVDVWSYVIKITDLERLMDKKAKDQLHQQLIDDPPEATVDNICATLDQFMVDAGMIWKRGIAEAFSNLDRRFLSHDGWKIGSRIILSYAFDGYGHWNFSRNHEATILDIERVFRILDDAPLGYGIVHEIDRVRRASGYGPRQATIETEYFRIRTFKNGNAHIWFLRDDLVEKVNQLLGEYYGAPIPEDREPDADTGLYDPKLTPAKRYGFFPTPDDAAKIVAKHVPLYRLATEPALTILEPSAGTGNLARLCFPRPEVPELDYEWQRERANRYNAEHRFDHQVDCVEIQPALAEGLRAEGIYRKVYATNFLALSPETTGLYDRVVMNPPFDRERDVDHVVHAMRFLKPDGILVAVMSAGTEFRRTKKSVAFRELMRSKGAWFGDLPAGSFASVGTYCNTIVVKINNAGSHERWSGGDGLNRRFEEAE